MTSWAAGSLFYDTGYYGYENPYYVPAATTTVVEYPVYDYSQPIVTTAAQPDMSAPAAVTAVSESEQARDAFYQGDYNRALTSLDAALAKTPDDVVLHEFRALALFAMQRYKEAAGTLYAVLSVGPGWDWTTMSGLYENIDTYTKQLRELESYVQKNPNDPDGHFVLAYHYLTAGHADPAAATIQSGLEDASERSGLPTDGGSALSVRPSASRRNFRSAAPAATSTEPQPASPPNVVGKWNAPAAGGGEVALSLSGDGKFKWTHSRGGKSKSFEGTYQLAGATLVMEYSNGGSMVGKVRADGDKRFSFKMVGGPANDPGLEFSK